MKCFSPGTYIPFKTHFVDLKPLHKELQSIKCYMNVDEVPKDVYEGLLSAAIREYNLSPAASDTQAFDTARHFLDGCIATQMAVMYAEVKGLGVHLGGGYHHATMNPTEANYFCLLNDFAFTALKNPNKRIAVLDFDFHRGAGSMFAALNIPNLSIFDHYFPSGALSKDWKDEISTRYEVLGEPFKTAEEYHHETGWLFAGVLDRKPDIVLYNAGADAIHAPLTAKDLLERDKWIFTQLHKRNIPVAITLGGGYDENAIPYWREMLRIAKEIFYAKG